MATLRQLIRDKAWTMDDSIERPPDKRNEVTPEIKQLGEDCVEEKCGLQHGRYPLPLPDEARRFLGTMLRGRWDQEFVRCVVQPVEREEIETPVRTIGELWFCEYLGHIAHSGTGNSFRSRELIEKGFPVGHCDDVLAPIGKVLRKFTNLGVITKNDCGPRSKTEYVSPQINQAYLKVYDLPDSYEFNF